MDPTIASPCISYISIWDVSNISNRMERSPPKLSATHDTRDFRHTLGMALGLQPPDIIHRWKAMKGVEKGPYAKVLLGKSDEKCD